MRLLLNKRTTQATTEKTVSFLKIHSFALDVLSCSHHRCAYYFMEPIRSPLGFYGWPCRSYLHYILGICPFDDTQMTLAGDGCGSPTQGMFLVRTNSESPFAKGRREIAANNASPRNTNDDELPSTRGSYRRDPNDDDKATSSKPGEKCRQFDPKVTLIDSEN